MKSLKVALLQLLPEDTLNGNLRKGLESCRKAKERGADIALFPEMWSVGYRIPENTDELKGSAITADSDFVGSFGRLAKELDMAIGITFLEKYEPLPRNTLCLFDRFGNRALTYAKVHTCDFGDEYKSRRYDLLRQGIPGKREDSDAERRRDHSGAERLPDGDQPNLPAAGTGV